MAERTNPREERVLRPDAATYRRFVTRPDRVLLPFALGLVASTVGRASSQGELLFVGALLVGTVIVTLAAVAITLRTGRIRLGDGRVEYTRWWLRRTALDTDGAVGLLASTTQQLGSRTFDLLVLRGNEDGARIRLNGGFWAREDLEDIAEHAGVDTIRETLTLREFEERAPGTMRFRDLHPWVTGVGLAIVILALVTAGVVAWFKHEGLPPYDRTPPREVSSATITGQDQLVLDLTTALGGTWQPADARLLDCEDEEQYDGWMRWVDVDRDGPGDSAQEAQVRTAIEVLEDDGYEIVDEPFEDGGAVLVSAIELDADREVSFDVGSVVDVDLTVAHSHLEVHGPCEVPDH